jgi:outer membrane protein OmpA-like peptidoglycan-associated protein
MTRTRIRAAGLAVGLLAAITGTGCGGDMPASPSGAANVAIVVGAHANAPAPTLTAPALDRLRAAVEGERTVAVVAAGGQPTVVRQADIALGCQNPDSCKAAVQATLDGIEREVRDVRPAGQESDLLAALALAADAVGDRPPPTTIAVIDSGLSTAGALRFQEPGVLDADPGELAEFLAARGELPDLAGTSVLFAGLGDVAPPQEPLALPQRTNLREIWTAIATRAGATDVQVLTEPLREPPLPDLPAVAPVPVHAAADLGCFGTLRQADLAFRPDLASFVDAASARATLAPMARCLAELGRPVRLTGTTASAGTEEGRRVLSQQRADAVAGLLAELGVPAGLITTRGLGHQVPPCVPDRDAAGALLPDLAAQNRQVIVEPAP